MKHNIYIYIAIMAAVSFIIRVLPLTFIRKQIKILYATQSPIAGAVALGVGIISAWFGASLFQVSVSCCAIVLLLELILI